MIEIEVGATKWEEISSIRIRVGNVIINLGYFDKEGLMKLYRDMKYAAKHLKYYIEVVNKRKEEK